MATNFYFNNFTNSQEQHLIEDLVTESIKIYGHDVYYLPRTLVARDSLYNQDDLSTFDSAYLVDMYIKNVEGFEGEGDLFQRFGVEIRDQITFVISQRTFDLEISTSTSLIRPNEGDLIFLPLNNKPFEIKFVEHEAVFYQMGSLQTYEMTCELYEYSGERFNTGITSIDNIENLNAPSTQIYVESVTGNYIIDETVYVSLPLIAGEQAIANLTPTVSSGQVSIAIANSGIGYPSNTLITVSAPDVEQANLSFNLSGGSFTNTDINFGGGFYSSVPTITFDPPNSNADSAVATATLGSNNEVISIDIVDGGAFYLNPPGATVTVDPPPGGVVTAGSVTDTGVSHILGDTYDTTGGSGTGFRIRSDSTGGLTQFTILDGGFGYVVGDLVQTDNAPYEATIRIDTVGTGTTATATAVVANGRVTSVTVTDGGDGYVDGAPNVSFSLPIGGDSDFTATATATILDGEVDTVTITSGGEFYDGTENISITAPNAVNARARMDVNSTGAVTSITMLDSGQGYRSAPTLTIPAPANNVVKATVAKITANNSVAGSYTLELNNLAANTNTLQFANSQILIGATSGASGTILDGNQTEETFDEEAQNEMFESEGDNILDFTDRDPFSEGGTF